MGVRVVNATTSTLYGAIIAGTFTLLGIMIERLLRGLGRLRCEMASALTLELTGVERGKGSREQRVPFVESDETTKANGVFYAFAVDLFNGREVPISLNAISVEIVLNNDRRIGSYPYENATYEHQLSWRTIYDKIDVINVPPRQFVHQVVMGTFDENAAYALTSGKWRSFEFVGKLPKRPFFGILGSKTFRKTIAWRTPYRDPFVQRPS